MSLIFCRVSSKNQVHGTSLNSQEESIVSKSKKLGWNPDKIVKFVKSVFKDCVISQEDVKLYKYKTLMFYSIDRFSRNMEHGMNIAKKLIDYRNILFFVTENIMLTKYSDSNWDKFLHGLALAEDEGKKISSRIKESKLYAKKRGFYSGGCVPYGMKIVINEGRKYLVLDNTKKKIAEFIILCRTPGTSEEELNNMFKHIYNDVDTYPIVLCNGNNNSVIENDGLDYLQIAKLLNEYNIDNIKWNSKRVRNICRYYKIIKDNDHKISNMDEDGNDNGNDGGNNGGNDGDDEYNNLDDKREYSEYKRDSKDESNDKDSKDESNDKDSKDKCNDKEKKILNTDVIYDFYKMKIDEPESK